MKKRMLLLLLTTLFSVAVQGQNSVAPGWYLYGGSIDNSSIFLSLYLDQTDNLKGSICFASNNDERIEIKGKKTGVNYVLYLETSNSKYKNAVLSFSHQNLRTDNETKNAKVIIGKLTRPVHLTLSSINPASYATRYQLDKSNSEVEDFFKEIKSDISSDHKQRLAQKIAFPITLNVGNTRLKIKNSREFVKYYSKIFHSKFKKLAANTCVCDLAANAQGVMLGDGIIWVSENLQGDLKVIAINN